MLQTIKNLLERNATLLAIFFTLLIGVFSLKNIHLKNPLEIHFFDKVLHFSAYAVLTVSWLFSQRKRANKTILIILLIAYGILLEFFQSWFTENRTKDLYDMIANTFGIIFAVIIFQYIDKCYKKTFGYHD